MQGAIKGNQVVVMRSWGGHSIGEIVKVTPSGQVVVKVGENESRFDSRGYEMGSSASKYRRDWLRLDVETFRVEQAALRHRGEITKLMNELGQLGTEARHTWSADSIKGRFAELEAKMAVIKQLVEGI